MLVGMMQESRCLCVLLACLGRFQNTLHRGPYCQPTSTATWSSACIRRRRWSHIARFEQYLPVISMRRTPTSCSILWRNRASFIWPAALSRLGLLSISWARLLVEMSRSLLNIDEVGAVWSASPITTKSHTLTCFFLLHGKLPFRRV
jgi:hypothetical protein